MTESTVVAASEPTRAGLWLLYGVGAGAALSAAAALIYLTLAVWIRL